MPVLQDESATRDTFIAARMSGKSLRQAAKLAGIAYRTACIWDSEGPISYVSKCVSERGDYTKEAIQIEISKAAHEAPVQYKAALLRLLADIKGWTKPQADEAGDRAAERLKAWLESIAKAQAPAAVTPPDESPTDTDATH